MNKSELTNLLANDDLDAAIQGLAGYARKYANPELYSEALIISGRLEEYKKQTRIGAAAYDTLLQHRAGVRAALMDLIKGLPETPNITLPSGKLPGLSEDKFKSSLFWLILSGNIVILFWLWFQSDTGGFTRSEVAATLTLLISVFTAYLMPMFSEMLQNRHINLLTPPSVPNRVRWSLPLLTYCCILPGYFGLMGYFIHLRGIGLWKFEEFSTSMTLLISGFGAYVATIINALFKKST